MSTGLRVVIALTACAVALALTAVVFGPMVVRQFDFTSGQAKTAAESYLATVRDHNPTAGHPMLCKKARSYQPLAKYVAEEARLDAAAGSVVSYRVDSLELPKSKEAQAPYTVVTTTATFNGFAVMRREGGHWRWCGVHDRGDPFSALEVDPRA